MMKRILYILFFLFAACSVPKHSKESNRVTQISTFDALLQGVFDGTVPLSAFQQKGNFGIGTFDALDGEMILKDGIMYQVKADGKIYHPDISIKTPFATVCYFHPEKDWRLNKTSFVQLRAMIDSVVPSPNFFYAIRIKGSFKTIHTRSVPLQKKPYPALVEVTKNQPEFKAENKTGQLIGFYCPEFVKGINVPGYHLHFLADDETFGGHLLGFELENGVLEIDQINQFEMLLPDNSGFKKSEYKTDRSDETKKVEGSEKI